MTPSASLAASPWRSPIALCLAICGMKSAIITGIGWCATRAGRSFRVLFGDERQDYDAALQRHHANGAPVDWANAFISAYATCHPFEDFAETWAHYMHIVDTLETANAFGLSVQPKDAEDDHLRIDVAFDPYRDGAIEDIVGAWTPVTVALNSLSCSLGQPDVYPFVLSKPVIDKLGFIHDLTRESRIAASSGRRREACQS